MNITLDLDEQDQQRIIDMIDWSTFDSPRTAKHLGKGDSGLDDVKPFLLLKERIEQAQNTDTKVTKNLGKPSDYTLRDYNNNLPIRAVKLSEVSSEHRNDGLKRERWTELSLYLSREKDRDMLIVQMIGKTTVPGENDNYSLITGANLGDIRRRLAPGQLTDRLLLEAHKLMEASQ